MMRFVLAANRVGRVSRVNVVITTKLHRVNLGDDESDADENVQDGEKREMNGGPGRRQGGMSSVREWQRVTVRSRKFFRSASSGVRCGKGCVLWDCGLV